MTAGSDRSPNDTNVAGLSTTSPAFFRPINAINKPIPHCTPIITSVAHPPCVASYRTWLGVGAWLAWHCHAAIQTQWSTWHCHAGHSFGLIRANCAIRVSLNIRQLMRDSQSVFLYQVQAFPCSLPAHAQSIEPTESYKSY